MVFCLHNLSSVKVIFPNIFHNYRYITVPFADKIKSVEHKMSLSFVQRRFMSSSLKKFCYNLSGFNKYGLMRDDIIYEDSDVQEALRRLPEKVRDDRNYRLLRAMQLSVQKEILPKEQWTKLEEDKLYLTPVVEQVIKEREEREAWEKVH